MRTRTIDTGNPHLNLLAAAVRELEHDLQGHGYVGDDLPPQVGEQTKAQRAKIKRVSLKSEAQEFVSSGAAENWLSSLGLDTHDILARLTNG